MSATRMFRDFCFRRYDFGPLFFHVRPPVFFVRQRDRDGVVRLADGLVSRVKVTDPSVNDREVRLG